MTTVKAFDEPYDRRLQGAARRIDVWAVDPARHRAAPCRPRHRPRTRSSRKLVIVLTDGEPSDIDVPIRSMLVEDARRAAVGLQAAGIDAYGVVLGQTGISAASRIFGRGKTMMVPPRRGSSERGCRSSISAWLGL